MLTYLSENVTVFVSRRRVSRSCQRNEIEYMHTQQVCNYVANDDESDDENTIWKLLPPSLPPSLPRFFCSNLTRNQEGRNEGAYAINGRGTDGRPRGRCWAQKLIEV